MYEKLQLDYCCAYSYNTVARVMRANGLLHERNKPKGLTKADKLARKSDNLLGRDFSANAPCEKVVTDITEWSAYDSKLYFNGIFDCYDNMCLGISLADNMCTELCTQMIKSKKMAHLKAKAERCAIFINPLPSVAQPQVPRMCLVRMHQCYLSGSVLF